MKTVLMAAAAAVSLAGAALAQQPTAPDQSTTAGQQGSMPSPAPGQGGTTPDSSQAPTNGQTQNTMPSGGQGSPSAPGASMPGSATPSADAPAAAPMAAPAAAPGMTANTPAGDAPSSYPACTKRGQDRCKSSGRRGR